MADLQQEPAQGNKLYAILVCIFASLGGVFFGYDLGATGGVIVMDSFLRDFCLPYGHTMVQCTAASSDLPSDYLNFTTLYNVLYYLGCIVGAYVGGVIADKYGRRMTIFCAGCLVFVGTCMLVFSNKGNHALALCARVVQGIGVGNASFSLPVFGAEMAPKELRGMLSGFMQMSLVAGQVLAGFINLGVHNTEHGWRTVIGVGLAFPVIVTSGIFCVPESPRWMFQHKGPEAAEATLVRLRKTQNVGDEMKAIGEALEEEGSGQTTWADVFHPSIRRRVYIAMALQLLQQATGVNPVFTYGGQIFKDVLGNGIWSLLILQIVNFFSTMPAMLWVDKFGRRSLLLIGAVGMVFGMVVAATAFTIGCHGNKNDLGCSKTAGWIMIAATAVFIFHFAISWGPVCWIYPAEIFPMKVRAKAVSLSTMANWAVGALMIGILKLFPYLHVNGVFYLFTGLCSCAGIFVYYFCPETKGLLLEEIELLFNGDKANSVEVIMTPVQEDKE
ncbi:hypothetical protein AC1031_008385 [Aphanomyces cochlioides]|nr:hypothetical protein AC1031_008385 [Aphanomyces cochlioides]